jgi:superfamily I DNA/RNA helicase
MAMNAIGIKDTSKLKKELEKDGFIECSRDQLFSALESFKDQINEKGSGQYQNFAEWLKESVAKHTPAKGAEDGVDDIIEESKGLTFSKPAERMKEAVEKKRMDEVKDPESARALLQEVIEGLDEMQFRKEALHELRNTLETHRKAIKDPDVRDQFDVLIGHLGFMVENDYVQAPKQK